MAAFEDARNKGAQIVGISTGGILTERMHDLELEVVAIPSGLQPRAALAISFVPMMYLLKAIGIIGDKTVNQLMNAADFNQRESKPV